MKCEQCGAMIDPAALACPYCHLTTPAGAAARAREQQASQAQAQWQAAVQYQNKQASQARIGATASQSLWLSIAGIVFCCLPIGVVGAVQGFRARAMAKAQGIEAPSSAIIGLVLGLLSCVTSIAFVTYAKIDADKDQKVADARIAELDKQIGTKSAAPTLDHATACALGEQYALRTGYDGSSGYTFKNFECVGKLSQTPDTASLEDFKLNASKAFVCFKHGAVWYVSELKADGCAAADSTTDSDPVAATATATSTPAAHHGTSLKHDAGVAAHEARDAH